MPKDINTWDGLRDSYRADAKALTALNERLRALRPTVQQYKDLADQHERLADRARVALLMLCPVALDPGELNGELDPEQLEINVNPRNYEKEKKALPLWKIIREITRQCLEIRIIALEAVLNSFGFHASRQAIDSAISTHRAVFQVTKKGREKFVSLK